MQSLEGEVTHIVFSNPENGFVIARISSGEHPGQVTIVGSLGQLVPGEHVKLSGIWHNDQRFGLQFKVESFQQLLPATLNGIKRYLESGMIKGIGPVMAGRLITRFGDRIFDVIENAPEQLLEVKGVARKTLDDICSSWNEQREIRDLMLFLQEHEIPTTFASRIYNAYGLESVAQIRSDPYELAYKIRGIGFKTADTMAMQLGFAPDDPRRLEAGILYALRSSGEKGNLFLPDSELLDLAAQLLACPDLKNLAQALQNLSHSKRVVITPLPAQNVEQAVFLTFFYRMEKESSDRLYSMAAHESKIATDELTRALAKAEKNAGLELSSRQREAVYGACENKLYILTGGPGTGKTTIIRMIVRALEDLGFKVGLAAPTGRAAKRMSEATGNKASTLHLLLGAQPNMKFTHNEDNKLKLDALIIDEVSMLDSVLFLHLLRALPVPCRLILVGDVNQLPSVGPGNVLRDLLDSQVVPSICLEHIFRQAKESMIVVNAHRVNNGQGLLPSTKTPPQADFFWVENDNPSQVQELIVRMVHERIPRVYGFDPCRDVQVLTPMHKGDVGTLRINELLQEKLNPLGTPLRKGQHEFRVGDRVLQTRNNYDKDVFNGDLGWIEQVDKEKNELIVDFDGARVSYEGQEIDDLSLAYALSVHKSQGSEYPAVIVPILTQHYIMLQRNLIYTALTRARKLAVLIGSQKALRIGLNNLGKNNRYTNLRYQLQELFNLTTENLV